MLLKELKEKLPYTYESVVHMFEIINIPKDEYDNVDVQEENWYMKYCWTDKQQEEYKDWLYRKLWNNKEWRKEMLSFSIMKKDLIDKAVSMFVFNYGLTVCQENNK